MIALLLSTLFAAATCLALGAIGSSWRSHGAALLELRGQIAGMRANPRTALPADHDNGWRHRRPGKRHGLPP